MKRHLTSDYVSFVGYEWMPRETIRPCITQVVEARRHSLLPHNKVLNGNWALDYFATPVRVKVGTEDAEWTPRKTESAHLYPPWLSYWEDAPPGPTPVHHGWIQFAMSTPDPLERFTKNRFGFGVFLDPDGLIRSKLREILAFGQDLGEAGFWRAQAALCQLLDLLLNAGPVRGREYRVTGTVALDPMVVAVRQYLRAHLDRSLYLKDVAHAAHVSVSTLTHRYVELTGESPMQTLQTLRLDSVRDILRRGGTIKEAAALTGYSSPQHLARVFMEVEERTPSEFIKDSRAADAAITGRGRDV